MSWVIRSYCWRDSRDRPVDYESPHKETWHHTLTQNLKAQVYESSSYLYGTQPFHFYLMCISPYTCTPTHLPLKCEFLPHDSLPLEQKSLSFTSIVILATCGTCTTTLSVEHATILATCDTCTTAKSAGHVAPLSYSFEPVTKLTIDFDTNCWGDSRVHLWTLSYHIRRSDTIL